MEACIITIGDELLYGQTVDTNSAWMGHELNLIGINVKEILSISDQKEAILEALERAEKKVDLVLITGGLGPTKDDITKNTLADYFGVGMKRQKEIVKQLEYYFQKRGIETPAKTLPLADMPENCTPLKNNKGTAWGMWFYENQTVFVSMPGVPAEMKGLMREQVLPKIKSTFDLPIILHKHYMTASVGESKLSEKLEKFEEELPDSIKLAYLPGLGIVKLRLTAKGHQRKKLKKILEEQSQKMLDLIGHYIYGKENEKLEAAIGEIIKQKGWKIGTAESCTGGFIAHLLTSIPGSSDYFEGSVISYSNTIKMQELNVSEEVLNEKGAVSEEVVEQMLKGICNKFNTEIGIAVSGIAGPGGGSKDKPVGTVWIAVGKADQPRIRKVQLPGNRLQNIELTAIIALESLRRYLLRDV